MGVATCLVVMAWASNCAKGFSSSEPPIRRFAGLWLQAVIGPGSRGAEERKFRVPWSELKESCERLAEQRDLSLARSIDDAMHPTGIALR